MTTVERLYQEVMALTPEEQDQLLARMIERRIEPAEDWLDAWADECERRMAEAGDKPGVPWEVVRENMWTKIRAVQR